MILVIPLSTGSARADENLAESAGQLGKMVELPNQSLPNLGLRPSVTLNIFSFWKFPGTDTDRRINKDYLKRIKLFRARASPVYKVAQVNFQMNFSQHYDFDLYWHEIKSEGYVAWIPPPGSLRPLGGEFTQPSLCLLFHVCKKWHKTCRKLTDAINNMIVCGVRKQPRYQSRRPPQEMLRVREASANLRWHHSGKYSYNLIFDIQSFPSHQIERFFGKVLGSSPALLGK